MAKKHPIQTIVKRNGALAQYDRERITTAILKALSIPTHVLEKEWHDSLKSKITWFAHLSYHLYDILFALMGLIAILAFIRLIIKKRALRNEESDETDFVA